MPAAVMQIIVFVVELAAKYGPGLLHVGENLVNAIQSHGELTEAEKADLVARVKATRAAVASYEPIPPPAPTRPG